jgi:guanylate kinase
MAEKSRNILLVVSAPSGAGKTTLCQQLLDANPGLTRAVTCTTRKPREGEVDGKDYYFLDAETFLRRVQSGDFIEHATVHNNSYGTLKSEIIGRLESGKDVLLNIDVQGEAAIRQRAMADPVLGPALVTLFLVTPTLAELEKRLRKRDLDSEEVIINRLRAARIEIQSWSNFDYLIVSQSIEEDLRRAQIILEAEKMRTTRTGNPLDSA